MTKSDEQVKKLFEIVAKKKKEIQEVESPKWRTNCVFNWTRYTGSTNKTTINAENSIDKLVDVYEFVAAKEKSWNWAASQLGVTKKFDWGGYSVADWQHDIQLRINKIQIAQKKKELETLESRLSAVLSPELKAELELEAIAKELEG